MINESKLLATQRNEQNNTVEYPSMSTTEYPTTNYNGTNYATWQFPSLMPSSSFCPSVNPVASNPQLYQDSVYNIRPMHRLRPMPAAQQPTGMVSSDDKFMVRQMMNDYSKRNVYGNVLPPSTHLMMQNNEMEEQYYEGGEQHMKRRKRGRKLLRREEEDPNMHTLGVRSESEEKVSRDSSRGSSDSQQPPSRSSSESQQPSRSSSDSDELQKIKDSNFWKNNTLFKRNVANATASNSSSRDSGSSSEANFWKQKYKDLNKRVANRSMSTSTVSKDSKSNESSSQDESSEGKTPSPINDLTGFSKEDFALLYDLNQNGPSSSNDSSGQEVHKKQKPFQHAHDSSLMDTGARASQHATRPGKKPKTFKLCTYTGCTSRARAFQLCKRHGGVKKCKSPACTRNAQSRGLCIAHGGGSRCRIDGWYVSFNYV